MKQVWNISSRREWWTDGIPCRNMASYLCVRVGHVSSWVDRNPITRTR